MEQFYRIVPWENKVESENKNKIKTKLIDQLAYPPWLYNMAPLVLYAKPTGLDKFGENIVECKYLNRTGVGVVYGRLALSADLSGLCIQPKMGRIAAIDAG